VRGGGDLLGRGRCLLALEAKAASVNADDSSATAATSAMSLCIRWLGCSLRSGGSDLLDVPRHVRNRLADPLECRRNGQWRRRRIVDHAARTAAVYAMPVPANGYPIHHMGCPQLNVALRQRFCEHRA
jgi:hypothetical protein